MPERFDPAGFLQAIAAGCAAVACADGNVSETERSAALELMGGDALLSGYTPATLAAAYDQRVLAFTADEPAAFFDAMDLLGLIAGRPEQARRVLHACLILSGADGHTHLAEIASIHAIRCALGLGSPPGSTDTAELFAAIAAAAARIDPGTGSLRALNATVARSAQVRALSRQPLHLGSSSRTSNSESGVPSS